MVDRDLMRQVELAGLTGLASASDVGVDLPSGVRVLDRWRSREHGGVVFWVDAELDLWGFGDGHAILHLAAGQLIDGEWRLKDGGGWGTFPVSDPVTHARALNANGQPLGSDSLLL